jgi:hypothetical protein
MHRWTRAPCLAEMVAAPAPDKLPSRWNRGSGKLPDSSSVSASLGVD